MGRCNASERINNGRIVEVRSCCGFVINGSNRKYQIDLIKFIIYEINAGLLVVSSVNCNLNVREAIEEELNLRYLRLVSRSWIEIVDDLKIKNFTFLI